MGFSIKISFVCLGLVFIFVGLLIFKVFFLEQFTFITHDHKITSEAVIQLIKLCKISFIMLGVIFLAFAVFHQEVKNKIKIVIKTYDGHLFSNPSKNFCNSEF